MEDQTLIAKFIQRWKTAWTTRRIVRGLGSEREAEREAALTHFCAMGEEARPILHQALRGPIRSACGAAVALDRMEDGLGVRRILRRAYDEEWLSLTYSPQAEIAYGPLCWLSREALTREFHRALDAAGIESELAQVLAQLSLALSAFRLLNRRDAADRETLQRGILFGVRSLRFLSRNSSVVLAYNLTRTLRQEATRGLLLSAPDLRLPIFADALQSRDLSVVRVAIGGVRRGGDRRAAAHLHPIAFGGGHPCAELAREAYARLVGPQADPLTLLRPSQEQVATEDLLRPAAAADNSRDRDELLRSNGSACR